MRLNLSLGVAKLNPGIEAMTQFWITRHRAFAAAFFWMLYEEMNKTAILKHQIYNKLGGFSEHDLSHIANFIDFMRHKKQLEEKKVLKLQGILKGYDIDFSDLKKFKKQSWEHVEQEFSDG